MKTSRAKNAIEIILIVVLVLVGIIVLTFLFSYNKTQALFDDFSDLYSDPEYSQAIELEDIDVVTQEYASEYAVMEMVANYQGMDITEKMLYDEYGDISMSSGASFCEKMNEQFPECTTTMDTYLADSDFLRTVYLSLLGGLPVPFEWADEYNGQWSIHYSLITGIDILQSTMTVADPYGYIETLPFEEFFRRTSFEAYENMPINLQFGFAFGVFEKNTVFVMTYNPLD